MHERGSATIHVDTARVLAQIQPEIYSGESTFLASESEVLLKLIIECATGFTEHMGRCIYGGLVDEGSALSDSKTGFRLDVIEALKELKVSPWLRPFCPRSVRQRYRHALAGFRFSARRGGEGQVQDVEADPQSHRFLSYDTPAATLSALTAGRTGSDPKSSDLDAWNSPGAGKSEFAPFFSTPSRIHPTLTPHPLNPTDPTNSAPTNSWPGARNSAPNPSSASTWARGRSNLP